MSVYYSLSCIIYLLNKVSPGHTTKESLVSLFNNNPDRLAEMGFLKIGEINYCGRKKPSTAPFQLVQQLLFDNVLFFHIS